MKTCDPKCYELAKAFLADEPDLDNHENAEALAEAIQDAIENCLENLKQSP